MADGRIPVLYIAPWIDLGGSDKGTIDWFRSIDRTRFAPSLILTQPSANRWLHKVEPFAEEIWVLPDLMPGAGFPEFILGFIETRRVQVVHIMNARIAFDLLPDMTNLPHPPVVVVQLHAEEPDRSGYVRYSGARYGNLVDAFSVTSRQLAEAMLDFDVARSRIEVIYTGIDAEGEFEPGAVEPFDLGDPGVPQILWPGRLHHQKDPMLTLDVLAELVRRGVVFRMQLVGDGPMAPEVRARATELGLDEVIRWHPPSLEMDRWYRSCDVLLMTSVFEGVPYVIYEAAAMEVPVVVPALAGNIEFVTDDVGVLIDPRDDVTAYVDALQSLLQDDERRRAMGRSARERMRRNFAIRDMAAAHERLYDRLLARRPATSVGRTKLVGGDELPDEVPELEPIRLPPRAGGERSVGIIVPCYQHGRYLRACIDSIREQTHAAARIVVVDDCSSDEETTAALDELEAAGDVEVLRLETNSGPSVARNRALALLDTTYVLPLDADDLLLPDALETMVEQLEAAPADIGFVYPNPQHFGNRTDYYEAPAYNLEILLQTNYCAATSLFDRRLFEQGIAYPEDVLFGHEDWDLVLQLAARGVWGVPARGRTFLYRKRGFSRVNAVEYGPEAFERRIAARHPSLYARRNRDLVKARWAPALSVVLVGDALDASWIAGQSCRDFEVVARCKLDTSHPMRIVEDGSGWLQRAVHAAQGRFVLVAGDELAAALAVRTFVEHLLRSFWSDGRFDGLAYVERPTPSHALFAPVENERERVAGVAWMRRPDAEAPLRVGVGADAGPDELASELEVIGDLQWRAVPAVDQVLA